MRTVMWDNVVEALSAYKQLVGFGSSFHSHGKINKYTKAQKTKRFYYRVYEIFVVDDRKT